MTFDELIERLDRVSGFGDRRKARCPAHDDNVASLAVREVEDGKLLLNCFAGCEPKAIAKALDIRLGDLAGRRGKGVEEVARYEYADSAGKVQYTKIRLEPKDFRFTPSGYRGPRYPYRLPEMLAATKRRIIYVEGEKDAEMLRGLGFVATTAGGVNDWRPEMAQHFVGRHVTIIPDNDIPGKNHARHVAETLSNIAKEVSMLELDVPDKGDVSDWIKGRTADDLREALKTAKPIDAYKTDGDLLSGLTEKPVEFAWFPRIPLVGLTFIYGEAGLGKSTFAIDILSRMSRGERMPMGAELTPARRIIALGFEDDIEGTVVGRFRAARADGDAILIERPSKYPKPTEPLIPGQLDWLRGEVRRHGAEVLFIDNIENVLTGSLDSNNSLSIRSALAPLVEMAQSMNLAVVALHHPKKGYLNVSAKEGMTGSQAYTNIARATLEAIEVPGQEGLYALAAVKVNGYPKMIRTLTYRLTETVSGMRDGYETFDVPTVVWSHETDMTADEMHREHVRLAKEALSATLEARPSVRKAAEFLGSLDWTGGRTWADVCVLGEREGHREKTLRTAREGRYRFDRAAGLWFVAEGQEPMPEGQEGQERAGGAGGRSGVEISTGGQSFPQERPQDFHRPSASPETTSGQNTEISTAPTTTTLSLRENIEALPGRAGAPVEAPKALPTDGASARIKSWVEKEREKHGYGLTSATEGE